MRGRQLLPWVGDKEAREAWDTLFSREMLGAVVIGSATGKLVENLITLSVLVVLGSGASALWETVGAIVAWGVAIPVGVWLFAFWHRVEDAAQEAVEDAVENAADDPD